MEGCLTLSSFYFIRSSIQYLREPSTACSRFQPYLHESWGFSVRAGLWGLHYSVDFCGWTSDKGEFVADRFGRRSPGCSGM